MSFRRLALLFAIGGLAAGLASAAVVLAVTAATRESPGHATAKVQATPTPEPCFLGVPNSSYTVTIQLTGPDAVNVCNDLVDPIRTMPALDGFKVVVGHHYSPYQICRYQRYGLTWTIWDQFNAPQVDTVSSFTRYPGAPFCP